MIPSPPSLLLWLTLFLCAPMPFFLVETGYQPLAALVQLFGVTMTLMATEGSSGAVTTAAWILGSQIVLGLAAITLLTWLAGRALRRTAGPRAAHATYAIVALIVAVACTQPIYRTPFRAAGLHASFIQVFE